MVKIIDASNREMFDAELLDMFRVRKRVFVDALKWNVPVVDGAYEIDQFDREDAVYLVTSDQATGEHLGSVRLLPTSEPHILGDLFAGVCKDAPPRNPKTWEISRLCTTPGVRRERAMRVRHRLAQALIEYGLLNGIERYVCVMNVDWLATLLAPGWTCRPLGEPKRIGDELLGGIEIVVDADTLQMFRQRWGGRFPVLRHFPAQAAA